MVKNIFNSPETILERYVWKKLRPVWSMRKRRENQTERPAKVIYAFIETPMGKAVREYRMKYGKAQKGGENG